MQGIRDGKRTTVSVGNIEVSSGNIEVSVWHIEEELKNMKVELKDRATQNQSTETNKAWCEVPELPKLTVGLDVL